MKNGATNRFRFQVFCGPHGPVNQIWGEIWSQVDKQVAIQVGNRVTIQVRNLPWNQVMNQVSGILNSGRRA